MNPFAIGSIVKTIDGSKTDGEVKFIACHSATSGGGKTCRRATCNHLAKDYCFVSWASGGMASYHHSELAFVNPPAASDNGSPSSSIVKADKLEVRDNRAKEEEKAPIRETIDFRIYNGFVQVREGRDGKTYLVDVANHASNADTPAIKEEELDYEAYATRITNVRKSR